jgi:hypothetical protein
MTETCDEASFEKQLDFDIEDIHQGCSAEDLDAGLLATTSSR